MQRSRQQFRDLNRIDLRRFNGRIQLLPLNLDPVHERHIHRHAIHRRRPWPRNSPITPPYPEQTFRTFLQYLFANLGTILYRDILFPDFHTDHGAKYELFECYCGGCFFVYWA
jgi:hypothetical protein